MTHIFRVRQICNPAADCKLGGARRPPWRSAIVSGALILLTACASAPAVKPELITLTVLAAASLKEAFTELGTVFETRNSGVTVVFNFAGSQQLAQQLSQGAPADVFASAHHKQMETAIEAGRVISGSAQTFAGNRLVVIFPQDNPAGLVTLQDLARPGLKIVLADKAVPVGQYSLDFLDLAAQDSAFTPAFKAAVLKNVMSYEESVRVVLGKVALGEADAGIVYASDISGENANQVGRLDLPDRLNTLAAYPIAVIKDSANPALAQAFVDWVLSPEGQTILAKHGFIAVKP